ncbi:alkaline phosphatase-like protein [Pseudovirgaria hyperparasitica]|uniref:GPI ethanolamine phosphate transferase 2 n=1 Tax=Pseudovirgaria hyperparasitica TaxID=470096 RepID=A0A6A6W065_9PEZI|nr:alkaline phosphatase-like protein [Pseudovirgaria hyperparasitica]KAF2755933.1 alkaline phosphatase-like protein [Pseudovirgaria hyperparasitica]
MACQTQKALLIIANLLIPAAVLTFAVGFFPYKAVLPGLATYRQLEYGDPPKAPFDKVVFMVVDALRSDFVYSENSGFKFTQSLIRSGNAIPFTAHASSPTITMPRVKAITTGSIPSFLDVIMNFAESDDSSTLANQDTWLAQMKAKPDGKLVMYGDDTWLRLFPGFFDREDGTSSFFVSDFTEVDNNVTRHVPGELRSDQSDWTGMIMHYLGLDHIGHKTGPLGPNMIPKQKEMDGIVNKIYNAIDKRPHLESTLFVLLGDHGMNEGGNHGGSAPGETSPALVFISPKMKKITKGYKCPTTPKDDYNYYRTVEQSDIAPTLAGLLGFPVPQNNLGVFIPEFFEFWENENDRAQLLLRNAMQILDIVKATFPHEAFSNPFSALDCSSPSSGAEELACKWRTCTTIFHAAGSFRPRASEIMPALTDFVTAAQSTMSSTASAYDIPKLIIGVVVSSLAAILALAALLPIRSVSPSGAFYTILLLIYGIMMFASSFVEEEQHIWYWTASFFLLYLWIRSLRTGTSLLSSFTSPEILALAVLRIARRYNQTGQKHAGAPDIAHSSFLTMPIVLWSLVGLTYLLATLMLMPHFAPRSTSADGPMAEELFFGISASVSIGFLAFVFKAAFTARDAPESLDGLLFSDLRGFLEQLPIVLLARLVFSALGLGLLYMVVAARVRRSQGRDEEEPEVSRLSSGLFELLNVFILTQTKTTNIPLFLLFRVMHHALSTHPLTPLQTTLTTLLMTHVSFFALGNSNAISSIDLSNAYNGVSGYNILAVGILVFAGNWAGPIWWCAAGVQLLKTSSSSTSLITPESAKSNAQKDAQTEKEWVMRERKRLAASVKPGAAKEEEVGDDGRWFGHVACLTLFSATSLAAVMVACTVLRTHLFVWTVFSPKYLYAMAWGTVWQVVVNVGLGGLFWCV